LLEVRICAIECRQVCTASLGVEGRFEIMLDIHDRGAKGARHTREWWDDDSVNPSCSSHKGCMHPACAAEREQGLIPRVAAAVSRNHANGAGHVLAGDFDDALGALFYRESER